LKFWRRTHESNNRCNRSSGAHAQRVKVINLDRGDTVKVVVAGAIGAVGKLGTQDAVGRV
jgi:hypothetical protein